MCTLFGFFTGMPGPLELLIIAMIILLLFGNRLPSVMRSMGRGITEFKKGIQGIEDDVDAAGKLKDAGEIKGKVNREPFEK
jgi:sec-independent protein translocase protein TatA